MRNLISVLFLFSIMITSSAQSAKPFKIYNKNGKEIRLKKVFKKLKSYEIILFGEFHNNSMNHWLQLQTVKNLHKTQKSNLILGAEMFERDNQEKIQQYLSNQIDEKTFAEQVRLWNNYKTDYKPLIEFAKENKLKFIATNIPRSYSSSVAKEGIECLKNSALFNEKWMMNLPVEISLNIPGYKEMTEMMKNHSDKMSATNFVAAQAVKDATMAESILENQNENSIFLHFNGNYHSKEYGGIYWYLKEKKSDLKIAVISVFESDNEKLKLEKDAILTEFNIVFPSDMTKTF